MTPTTPRPSLSDLATVLEARLASAIDAARVVSGEALRLHRASFGDENATTLAWCAVRHYGDVLAQLQACRGAL